MKGILSGVTISCLLEKYVLTSFMRSNYNYQNENREESKKEETDMLYFSLLSVGLFIHGYTTCSMLSIGLFIHGYMTCSMSH